MTRTTKEQFIDFAGDEPEEQDKRDAARYRLLRRGQHWSVVNGIGDNLRAEQLDKVVDDVIAISAMRRAASTNGKVTP